MHAIDLTSLAATYVLYAEAQLASVPPLCKRAAESFWLVTRYRHEYWSERLAVHRAAIQRPGVSYRNTCWREILPVIQEVLISEPLTRCVAYQSKLIEEIQLDDELVGFASSALGAHVEARHRCLHLIVFGTGLSPEIAVGLNRLRRSMEQFNDQLLGLMRPIRTLPTYCFDDASTACRQRQLSSESKSSVCRRLHTSGLLSWLFYSCWNENELCANAANPRLNALLSQSVLAMFPGGQFDGFGLPKSQEAVRLVASSLEGDAETLGLGQPNLSPLNVFAASSSRPHLTEPDHPRW